jgi:hypothetical protein
MRGTWTRNRLALAAVGALTATAAAQSPVSPVNVEELVARVGLRVGEYFRRAESIVCLERVMVQPIRSDLTPDGFARVLEYELRVAWETAADGEKPEATVLRQLRRINGREAPPGAEPKCIDPRAISPEPLAFLLPSNRGDYVFSLTGAGRDRNRAALILAYKSRVEGKPTVTTKDDCTSVDLPGWSKGRVWLDPSTHDVLRFEESLTKRFDYHVPAREIRFGRPESWTLDRADTSIRYRPVVFTDPEETVLLPESIESLVIFRGPGVSGHRTTQTFSGYKRFVTAGRLVK